MKNLFRNFVRTVISLVLTQEPGNTIHAALLKFKNKNKWFFRLLYGSANDENIFNSISDKLNEKFDILMVHSSFDGMIPMYTGNLSKLLNMLISYCKEKDITLAMPTFFAGSNLQAKEYYESGKHTFNVRKTASQIGLLTELFRITKGVKRSIHPTHSVCALGPLAEELTKQHHLSSTTLGVETPFGEMIKYKTIILGIGTKSQHSLTQLHAAEDIMGNDYPIPLYVGNIPVKCVDESGETIVYNLRVKNPEYTFNKKTFYKILKKIRIRSWKYKGIPFYITRADAVTETVIQAAKQGQTIYKKRK
ncbi:MAG TPA: AAC(3) family N-acetyltransferase [Ignavibacteriaceae bacterium]|nr:AAC(3) family N-acetyltransferase [Ignavibacteriaceae bacterium]